MPTPLAQEHLDDAALHLSRAWSHLLQADLADRDGPAHLVRSKALSQLLQSGPDAQVSLLRLQSLCRKAACGLALLFDGIFHRSTARKNLAPAVAALARILSDQERTLFRASPEASTLSAEQIQDLLADLCAKKKKKATGLHSIQKSQRDFTYADDSLRDLAAEGDSRIQVIKENLSLSCFQRSPKATP